MDIKINGETTVKDFYNEIVIIDGENTIKLTVPQAKKLFKQLEDTLFDESESHRAMEKKVLSLEIKVDELELELEDYKYEAS